MNTMRITYIYFKYYQSVNLIFTVNIILFVQLCADLYMYMLHVLIYMEYIHIHL